MTTNKCPTTTEIADVIDELISGSRTRSEVASWAYEVFSSELSGVDDGLLEILENLGAVDVRTSPEAYLYSIDDLSRWKNELLL